MRNFLTDKSKKLAISDECKFSGSGFHTEHEIGECSVAVQLIPVVKNVVEIGGGTGKVSHMINQKLKDRTQHVVIEPGSSGKGNHGNYHLWNNKKNFNDKYTIVKKFAEDLLFDDLRIFKHKPDCLFVDCEGCLEKFQNTYIGKYIVENVRYIVNEMDGNNDNIKQQWKNHGFKKIATGYGCGTNCETEIWYHPR